MATTEDELRRARVNLIPTDEPRAPVPGEGASGSDLERNLTALSTAVPGAGPAVGGIVRGAGALGRAAGASGTVRAVAPYVAPALGVTTLGVASAPAQQPATASNPAAAPSPASPTGFAAGTQTDVQRGGAASPATDPTALPLGMPGVKKTVVGDKTLYSDGTNPAADASLMARGPISEQNMGAADALAARYDGSAAARNAQYQREVAGAQAANAAGAANAHRVEQDMEREKLLKFAENTPSRSRAAGAMGLIANSATTQANERTADAQLGFRGQELQQTAATSAARNQVDQARLGLDTRKSNLDASAQQQMLAAQQAVTNATTEAARTAAEDNLRALQGRYEKTFPTRFTVVPGGKDDLGNTLPSQVLNNQTGEFVQPAGARGAQAATVQPGTVQRGYRFKGGDPSVQTNWEKV